LKGETFLKKGTLLSVVFLLVFGLLLAACGSSSSNGNSNGGGSSSGTDSSNKSSEAGKGNTIVLGADTTFPPFESQQNGQVVGFDIDMMKAIAKKENLKLNIKTMPFEGLIPALQSGQLNAAVAGMTIKTSRMKGTDFSNAYYKSGLSILVKKDSKISGIKDLKGHLVATKKGTSSVDYLKDHGITKIKQFQNINDAYQTLESGGADAVLFDNPVNINFKAKRDNVKIVGGLLTGEYYGIAVSKKNPDLLKKVNDGLAKIKKDGTYKKLFDKWLDGDTSGIVKDVKTPEDVAVKD
jgi:polar amino acid transport system substrate-binding protein/glutamine transport system substrate-binding protein